MITLELTGNTTRMNVTSLIAKALVSKHGEHDNIDNMEKYITKSSQKLY